MTIMAYTNLTFDSERLFRKIKVGKGSEAGTIKSIRFRNQVKGDDCIKYKKKWCTVCQPQTVRGEKVTKVNTITPFLSKKEHQIRHVLYYCSNCDKTYDPSTIKKINHFLNQLSIIMHIGGGRTINMMVFSTSFKIPGCKDPRDARKTIKLLFAEHIFSVKNGWKFTSDDSTKGHIVFETVMRNVDFNFGSNVSRARLNLLMNRPEYKHNVQMSKYESTNDTEVNIKMYSRKPEDFMYDSLYFKKSNIYKMKRKQVKDVKYRTKKTVKSKEVTFIVFSSSKSILSGRYDSNMKEMYEFFMQTVLTNKEFIAERICRPDLTKFNNVLKPIKK